jgi:hypothetical protein
MAPADYNYCFTYIDAVCNGIVSDGGEFNSSLYQALEDGLLPGGQCIIGDEVFPLKTDEDKSENKVPYLIASHSEMPIYSLITHFTVFNINREGDYVEK